jgi:hypothetical protein
MHKHVVAREPGVDVSNSCTIALYRSQLCDRQCVNTATLDAMKAMLPDLFDGHTSCRSLKKFLLTKTKSPRNEIDSNDSESQSETEVEMEFDENATACASLTGETLRRSKRRVTSKLVTPRTRDCHSSSPWTESHSRILQADRECWRGRQFQIARKREQRFSGKKTQRDTVCKRDYTTWKRRHSARKSVAQGHTTNKMSHGALMVLQEIDSSGRFIRWKRVGAVGGSIPSQQ